MVSYISTFKTFLFCGGLAVGNGYSMIHPLRRQLVDEQKRLSAETFDHAVTIAETMPGVFSLNLSAYLGRELQGVGGSIVAVTGILLPPLAVLLVVAGLFQGCYDNIHVQSFLKGARPAIVALILLPCVQLLRSAHYSLSTIWLPIGALLGVWLLGVPPAFIVLAVATVGALYAIFIK
ncbi:MAG: chromate transporter [Bacteroidaceae bacterium]|nr:chromate transporter [Bacteroidaceae bacterium]MBR2862176.1 chromate transporter [Bacteroidaceae bacterium]